MLVNLLPVVSPDHPYPNGGSESTWMLSLATNILPRLKAKGIRAIYRKWRPHSPIASRQRLSIPILLIALQTLSSDPDHAGKQKGAEIRYPVHDRLCRGAALSLYEAYLGVYPEPSLVKLSPLQWKDVKKRRKRAVVELYLAYRDNPQDEIWLTTNLAEISIAIAQGIVHFIQTEGGENV